MTPEKLAHAQELKTRIDDLTKEVAQEFSPWRTYRVVPSNETQRAVFAVLQNDYRAQLAEAQREFDAL